MMNIDKNTLWDYADGLLSDEQTKLVQQQLLENESLHTDYKQIINSKKQLSSFDLSSPDEDFAAKVMAQWQLQNATDEVVFKPNYYLLAVIGVSLLVLFGLIFSVIMTPTAPLLTDLEFSLISSFLTDKMFVTLLLSATAISFVFFVEKCFLFFRWKRSFFDL